MRLAASTISFPKEKAMINKREEDLLNRFLPKILTDNPGLAEKIAAMPDPGAAALAVVKNSPDYAFDNQGGESGTSRNDWFKTAPTPDFLAYAEKVKNETAEGLAPWKEGLTTGPPYSLDNPPPVGGMLPGTTMDIFGRPSPQELAGLGDWARGVWNFAKRAAPAAKHLAPTPSDEITEGAFKIPEYTHEEFKVLMQKDFDMYMKDPEGQHCYKIFNGVPWRNYGRTAEEAYPKFMIDLLNGRVKLGNIR